MSNVALYLSYARVAQYEDLANIRRDMLLKGGAMIPDYSRLLYILQTQIGKRFAAAPNDPTLTATSEYMYSLSGARKVNTTPLGNPLVIVIQPQSQTVNSGSNITFSVTAAGGAPAYTYQWYFNNVAIGGATNQSLVLNSVTGSNAGNYKVVVTDSVGGTVTSNVAVLTVNTATVAVFAVPVPSDPFPLTVDSYTYTYTQNVLPTANIGWNLLQADNDVNWWIFKEPIGNTPKVKYNNGTNLPNAGSIPDSVVRAPVILGGFRYYLTRIQFSYEATQPVNLTTS